MRAARLSIRPKAGSIPPLRPKIVLNSSERCPNHGTACTRNLIWAQYRLNMQEKAFHLGNVRLNRRNSEMTYSEKTSLEDRMTALEAQNEKLTTHLKTTVVLLSAFKNNPWLSPLQNFFAIADGLFDGGFDGGDGLGQFRCEVACAETLDAMLDQAGDNEAARTAAFNTNSACVRKCSGLPG